MKYDRLFLYLFSFMIFASVGCNYSDKQKDYLTTEKNNAEIIKSYDGIPSTAYQTAENDDFIIFLNDETVEDSIEGLHPVKQVSLWAFDKSKKSAKKMLLTNSNANGSWFTMQHAVRIRLDSIPTISRITILSWPNKPLKLLAEGCSDYRNVMSFVVSEDSANAICLPTNRGLLGVSEEDGLLIMQSYEYYEDGGRYNVIEAFDEEGHRISSMVAKIRN